MKKLQLFLCLFLSFSIAVYAQDSIPTAITSGNNTGDLPYSTSIGTDTEHVELSSGNLIVNIPFVDVPGRKMSFDFGVRYWTARSFVPLDELV